MTEEGLNRQPRAHVPNRDRSVSTTTNEEVSIRLEIETVYTVSVLAVLLANLERVQIEKFHSTISRCGEGEISRIMELDFPDWPGVNVGESVSNR